jgi:hypothetical protein
MLIDRETGTRNNSRKQTSIWNSGRESSPCHGEKGHEQSTAVGKRDFQIKVEQNEGQMEGKLLTCQFAIKSP